VNLTLSPQIKIVALVGLLAAVGLMASLTLLGGHSSSGTNDVTSVQRLPHRNTATTPVRPATTPAAKHTTTAAKTATTPAKTAAKPHVHAKPKPKPKPVVRGNLVYSTLPSQLQYALSQNEIVVVSTYDPNADVDKIAAAEAYAGASDAKVGFLLVNVLDDAVAGRLTALLPGGGLLPDPGVLVYKAPGNIAFRFDGFVDRATVAQAAANASHGEATGAATG
jgi:hypothetical protein